MVIKFMGVYKDHTYLKYTCTQCMSRLYADCMTSIEYITL